MKSRVELSVWDVFEGYDEGYYTGTDVMDLALGFWLTGFGACFWLYMALKQS